MNNPTLSTRLWGKDASATILIIASLIMMLGMLSQREIWTLETRWANIVIEMLSSGDYFHPMLNGHPYYDKPLLSYWLIVFVQYFLGGLNTFSLRLPSAIAGLVSLWCCYRLAYQHYDKQAAHMTVWLLITTYYFVFWSRIASADSLNMAGNLLAITWYFEKQERWSTTNISVFFMLLALTSLCKGLLGLVIPVLVLGRRIFKKFTQITEDRRALLRRIVFASIFPCLIYFAPFLFSNWTAAPSYSDNGLSLVFKENITRFFSPWDHKGPIWLYLLYLPIYTLPWSVFFWRALKYSYKAGLDGFQWWLLEAIAIQFIFFTLAGSRRSYYILPLVPWVILFIASWLRNIIDTNHERQTAKICGVFFALLLSNQLLLTPLFYGFGGFSDFGNKLIQQVHSQQPDWRVLLLNADNKMPIYLTKLEPAAIAKNMPLSQMQTMAQDWQQNTIIVTERQYSQEVSALFPHHKKLLMTPSLGKWLLSKSSKHDAIAYVPQES